MSTKEPAPFVKRGAYHVDDAVEGINQSRIRNKICCISVILHHQISIPVQVRAKEARSVGKAIPLHVPPAHEASYFPLLHHHQLILHDSQAPATTY